MKLLIIARDYFPEINAPSIRLSQIVKRLLQDDKYIKIRLAIFNPEYRDDYGRVNKAIPKETIEIIRYKRRLLPSFAFKPHSLNPLFLAYWVNIVLKEIEKFDPDVVLTTTPPFAPSIAVYAASLINRKRFIYAIDYRDDLSSVIDGMAENREFYIRYPLKIANKLMSSLLFRSIRNAALISTVNEYLQKVLQNYNKLVLLVPNGLEIQELKEIEYDFDRNRVLTKNGIIDTESKIIAYLGDLNMPNYMPETILEPMRRLKAKGYNLIYIIIGDGRRRNFIEQTARDLGLGGSINLLGRKNHKDAMELLFASDVAVYTLQKADPQAGHAIGTKVYEYLGCRLPILAIADKGSAVSKLVSENGVGVSVSWDELDRIEFSLRDILDHTEIYENNLEKRYQYFLNWFDRNKGIDRLYESLKMLRPR